MKFSEMKYTRPDLEEIKGRAAEIKNSFENAPDFDSADRAFTEWDSFTSHIDTMMSLAYTRHTINTEDEYYEAEVEYIDEISPEFTDICQGCTKLLTNSKYKEQFAEKYGSGHTVAPWVSEAVMLSTMPKQWNMGTWIIMRSAVESSMRSPMHLPLFTTL